MKKIKRKALVKRLKGAWDAAVTAKKDAAELARLKSAYAEALADSLGKEDEEIDDPDHKSGGDGKQNKAADGTVRKLFAQSIGENSVHGSDSPENAAIEIAYFFSGTEIVG